MNGGVPRRKRRSRIFWMQRGDHMHFISVERVKSRTSGEPWSVPMKRREKDFNQKIGCVAFARQSQHLFAIGQNMVHFTCGSVGIAAAPPLLSVMVMFTFVTVVMTETATGIECGEGGGSSWRPYLVRVKAATIQIPRDATNTKMERNKSITVLRA